MHTTGKRGSVVTHLYLYEITLLTNGTTILLPPVFTLRSVSVHYGVWPYLKGHSGAQGAGPVHRVPPKNPVHRVPKNPVHRVLFSRGL